MIRNKKRISISSRKFYCLYGKSKFNKRKVKLSDKSIRLKAAFALQGIWADKDTSFFERKNK
jgi:hypothetical protein